jgi:hypothetical protein
MWALTLPFGPCPNSARNWPIHVLQHRHSNTRQLLDGGPLRGHAVAMPSPLLHALSTTPHLLATRPSSLLASLTLSRSLRLLSLARLSRFFLAGADAAMAELQSSRPHRRSCEIARSKAKCSTSSLPPLLAAPPQPSPASPRYRKARPPLTHSAVAMTTGQAPNCHRDPLPPASLHPNKPLHHLSHLTPHLPRSSPEVARHRSPATACHRGPVLPTLAARTP